MALLPPILWSVTNHIDKYLLTKFFNKGAVGSVMIFSASVSVLLLPVIAIIHPVVLQQFNLSYLLIVVNGSFYLLATLPYFYALDKDDASLTVPLFQMIPVFSFILGYIFLGEVLDINQILGGIIILVSSVFISLNLADIKKIHMKWDVFLLMVLSSLLYSLNFIFFKYFAVETDFFITSFWEYIGFGLFGLFLLIFIKSYRDGFISVLNIVAKISFNYASILAPVTLIWIINGLQPFFVFLFGIILTILFPRISKEDISRKTLAQRMFAILAITIGVYLVNRAF